MLTQLAPSLWECNAPMKFFGMALGHRMTVAKLSDGSLWVHSPVAFSESLAAELATLGPIAHLVAPNYMHDTYLEGWLPRYPGVRFYAPRSFHKVFPAFKITDRLDDSVPVAWSDVFTQHVVRGIPLVHEVVFLHRPSRTLIVADLTFNLGSEMPLLSKVLLKLDGCYDCFAVSRVMKIVIKDRAALRASINHVLAWDFDRIVVAHGANIETGGQDTLRTAFAFLSL